MLRPDLQKDHDRINDLLRRDDSVLIGRIGSGELRIIVSGSSAVHTVAQHGFAQYSPNQYVQHANRTLKVCTMHVGVAPPTLPIIVSFTHRYIEATKACTVIASYNATWFPGEIPFTRKYAPTVPHVHASVLGIVHDFARYEDTWMRALDGQRVLIVHPFVRSIREQFEKGFAALFGDDHHMPRDMKLVTVQAPLTQQSPNVTPERTWVEHLRDLERSVHALRDEFDIALLGCGGYGMPVAHYISDTLGKKAVYVGGALQIMFGVRGKRWDARDDYSCLVNDAWVRPRDDERPSTWSQIEHGCYW